MHPPPLLCPTHHDVHAVRQEPEVVRGRQPSCPRGLWPKDVLGDAHREGAGQDEAHHVHVPEHLVHAHGNHHGTHQDGPVGNEANSRHEQGLVAGPQELVQGLAAARGPATEQEGDAQVPHQEQARHKSGGRPGSQRWRDAAVEAQHGGSGDGRDEEGNQGRMRPACVEKTWVYGN